MPTNGAGQSKKLKWKQCRREREQIKAEYNMFRSGSALIAFSKSKAAEHIASSRVRACSREAAGRDSPAEREGELFDRHTHKSDVYRFSEYHPFLMNRTRE
jgi:hypothetical protein